MKRQHLRLRCKLQEVIKGKQSRAVAVGPHGLNGVTSDQGRAHETEGIRSQRKVRPFVKIAHDVPFALAAGAWTMPAQLLQRDEAFASVVPLDGQFIANGLKVGRSHVSTVRADAGAAKFFLCSTALLPHVARMGKRREARERAVQFLFQHDLNAPEDLDRALDEFWESQRAAVLAEEKGKANWGEKPELAPPTAEETATRLFADPLIRGALQHRAEADERIQKYCKNWDLHRIAAVDRNILRLAIFEMLHRDDIPPVVSINEAVDIAKKFSTDDSGKFVNGILDSVKGELMRPAREVRN